MNLKANIEAEATRLGFSFCGMTRSMRLDHLRPFYADYLDHGKHEPFSYLKNHAEKRLDPSLLLPGVKSVVALLMNYHPAERLPKDGFQIAKYALGGDYHPLMKERMAALVQTISTLGTDIKSRFFVDSGPVLEKTWAERCGVGWIGKNSLLINKKQGSFFFIGIILTTLELDPDPMETDHCGACHRCVDACPTKALNTPYQLDIARCISFHTIESQHAIPDEINQKRGGWIYGCDICQDVCPYNRLALPTTEPTFIPSNEIVSMTTEDWRTLTPERFGEIFKNSAIHRRGYASFMRTLASTNPPD